MIGQRALEILAGFTAGPLAFTAEEIEELLGFGLVIEADPDDFAAIQWLVPAVREFAGCELDDPAAAEKLAASYAELDGKLKRDWYRFTTSDDKLAKREQERKTMRRALAYLNDKTALASIVEVVQAAKHHLPAGGARYAPCPQLGGELYALTTKGAQVQRQLALRSDRYAPAPLAGFMKAYDKTSAKMQAFAGEIATLSQHVGYVKKNPHQVVIGLAKTGAPAPQAINTYRQALQQTQAPDVAVTCARNADTMGGPQAVAQRLRQAQQALQRVGFARSPIVDGAAKTLLPFEPLATGAQRFRELYQLVTQARLAGGDLAFKLTARLMPAEGAPLELVRRAQTAAQLLLQYPSTVDRSPASPATAVALASMVRGADALPALVQRFRQVESELVRFGVSFASVADSDALECVACPGTPTEVASTVQTLVQQIAAGREPQRPDVAVAVAFAKRFAY